MSLLPNFAAGLRTLLRKRQADAELHDELATYLAMSVDDKVTHGMSPADAARAVRLENGSLTTAKETVRAAAWESFVETCWQDIRFGFRMLRKNRGFTAVAVLTLALGIGANTAIFSVVYAVLLKPLPYAHSGQLLNVFQQKADSSAMPAGWSYPSFEELRGHTRVFSALASAERHQLALTGHGDALLVDTAVVTEGFFSLFDVTPLTGRTFYPDDGKPGAAPVVVISEKLWRGAFAADPHIVGSAIDLDKRAYTVIGVMPADFPFPLFAQVARPPQVWVPLLQDPLFGPWTARHGFRFMQVTGRVKPGVSMAAVQSELDGLAANLAREFPAENSGWTIRTVPLQEIIVGKVKSPLFVLLGAVGLVLLIACANIANLFLTRATSRTREIAMRVSLGAGRARIVRQLLSETALLGLLGGAAGVAVAYAGVAILSALVPPEIPIVNAIRLDSFVLFFALSLSLIAGIACGVAPAFLIANSSLSIDVREGGSRSGQSSAGRGARNLLAIAEIALAMMLLVGAGLLLRSFSNLTAVNPGFNVQHLVKAEVDLPRINYPKPSQWTALADDLLAQMKAQPGLADSALALPAPISTPSVTVMFDIAGKPAHPSTPRAAVYFSVSDGYFHTMGVSLLSGRLFDPRDRMSAPNVTVISRAMARMYFPNEDPLGKQLSFAFPPSPAVPRQIVGIVADVRDASLGEEPKPTVYVPFQQTPYPGAIIVVNSPLSLAGVTAGIRQSVAHIDKDLPVTEIATMPDILNASLAQPRFRTFLLSLFAAMALVLATTGIFGVIAYSVARRTHEIGIRVALGATRGAILRLVSRETAVLVGAGLLAGCTGALAASRLLNHLLFGVASNDPVTLIAVSAILATVAAAAAYIPARRATRIDPVIALRDE